MARTRTVLVPRDLPIVYDATGWRFADVTEIPPRWWLDLTDPDVADAPQPVVTATALAVGRRTSCRPGSGPCRRRHEHASRRRAA